MTRLQRAAVAVWDRLPVPVQNLIWDRHPQLGERLDALAAQADQAKLDRTVALLRAHMLGGRAS